jgi:hypothetical protein
MQLEKNGSVDASNHRQGTKQMGQPVFSSPMAMAAMSLLHSSVSVSIMTLLFSCFHRIPHI